MNHQQILARLDSLAGSAGERLYERLTLVRDLLNDHGWVHATDGGGGDEYKALKRLETRFFGEICGPEWSLAQMLEVLREQPDISVWKKHHFNLRMIWSDIRARNRPEPAIPKRAQAPRGLTAPSQFTELTPSQAREEYKRAISKVETVQEKYEKLLEENAQLKVENAQLKAEISRLKSKIKEALVA